VVLPQNIRRPWVSREDQWVNQCLLVPPVGGWFIIVMFICAVQYSTSSFLGTYIRPDQLTLANLTTPSPPEAFESAIANAELLGPGVRGELGPGEVVAAAALAKGRHGMRANAA